MTGFGSNSSCTRIYLFGYIAAMRSVRRRMEDRRNHPESHHHCIARRGASPRASARHCALARSEEAAAAIRRLAQHRKSIIVEGLPTDFRAYTASRTFRGRPPLAPLALAARRFAELRDLPPALPISVGVMASTKPETL
jgi:hypothetical protein